MLLHAHFGDKPTRGQSSGGLVNSLTTVNSPTATFFKLQKDYFYTEPKPYSSPTLSTAERVQLCNLTQIPFIWIIYCNL